MHHLCQHLNRQLHIFFTDSWMQQEHETGFTQFPGKGQSFLGSSAGVLKGLFQIHLGAGA